MPKVSPETLGAIERVYEDLALLYQAVGADVPSAAEQVGTEWGALLDRVQRWRHEVGDVLDACTPNECDFLQFMDKRKNDAA